MKIGKLKHRITFQEKVASVDSDGFVNEDVWNDVATVWSQIKTLKGKEYYQAAAIQNESNKHFIIRYNPNIQSDMRINFKNTYYEIHSITNDDELNQSMTIVASRVGD